MNQIFGNNYLQSMKAVIIEQIINKSKNQRRKKKKTKAIKELEKLASKTEQTLVGTKQFVMKLDANLNSLSEEIKKIEEYKFNLEESIGILSSKVN